MSTQSLLSSNERAQLAASLSGFTNKLVAKAADSVRGMSPTGWAGIGTGVVALFVSNRTLKLLGFSFAAMLLLRDRSQRLELPAIVRRITIGSSAETLIEMLADPRTLGTLLEPMLKVEVTPEGRWNVGTTSPPELTWRGELLERGPQGLLWRAALEGALVAQVAVDLQPAPGDWGTELSLRLEFEEGVHPFQRIAVKSLRRVADALVGTVLHRLKSMAETGEIPSLHQQPDARHAGRHA